ncbi:MAG: V-type ATPase subunit [Eubacteriales bacterium]|nr:V-type ATPase subunit [Eubacteriales bacterium]
MSERKITDRDYLFVTAMVEARKARMLTRERMEQMLSTGSAADAARMLNESGYLDMSEMDARGVDQTLSNRRRRIFTEMSRFVPEPAVLDVFRAKYDYHNAKVLVKAEGAGVAAENILSTAGRVEPEILNMYFHEDDIRFLPPLFGPALREAKMTLARTSNPQMADLVLDKAYYAELLAMTKPLYSPFLYDYVRFLIDTANLRTVIRTTRMGRSQKFIRSVLIDGGTVSIEHLAASVGSGDGLSGIYASTPLRKAAELGAGVLHSGSMTQFEQSCDDAATAYLQKGKLSGFGLEAVAGYLGAVEGEIMAVRMILTGLMAGIDPEELKRRLRDTYV